MSSREITMVVCFHQIINGSMSAFYVSSMLAEDRRTLLRRWGQFTLFAVADTIFFALLTPYAWPRGVATELANLYFTLCCFSKPLKERLLTLFSTVGIAVVLELCTYTVMYAVFGSSKFIHYDSTINSMIMAAGAIVINMMFFLVYVMIIVLKKIVLHQIRKKEFWVYITIPVYQFFVLVLFLRTYPTLDRTMLYMGTLLFMMNLLLAFFIIYCVDHLISRIQVQEKLSALTVKRKQELDYYLQVQKNLDDMRAMKHDFANQLQTLHMLLQSEADRETVMEFIDSLCLADGKEEFFEHF